MTSSTARDINYNVFNWQASKWQKRRSAFNHDWMKNKYLQALDDWMVFLNGGQEDEYLELTFVSKKLPQWEKNRVNALWLYENFEKEMSPRVLFYEHPLSTLDTDTKQWLGDLIHAIWLERYGIRIMLERFSISIERTDAAYERLCDALKSTSDTVNIASLRPLKSLFSDFRSACGAVASAVEKFPSEVLVH